MLGFDLETYPIGPKRAPKVIVGAMNILDEEASKFQVDLWATRMKSLPDSKRSVYFFWADKLDQFLDLCDLVEGPVVAHNAAYDWSCISAMDSSYLAKIFDLYKKSKIDCTYIRTLVSMNAKGVLKTQGMAKVQLAHGKYGNTSLVGACNYYCGLDLSEDKDHDVQVTYYKVENVRNFFDWSPKYRVYLIQDVEHLHTLFEAQGQNTGIWLLQEIEFVDYLQESTKRAFIHFTLTLASAWGMRVDPVSVHELRNLAEDEVRKVADALISQDLATELVGKARERAVEKNKLTIKVDSKKMQVRVEEAYRAMSKPVPRTDKGTVSTTRSVLKNSGDELLEAWADVGDKKTVWSTFIPALEKSFKTGNVINTSFFPYSETGRVSARNPNLLNPPRSGGIRECVVAREGCCFIFCDYEANELRVLSQVLLDQLGRSRLAELYIEDPEFDPHTYMACRRLRLQYSEGKRRKAEGDKDFKFMRQLMKCCNFGFPGGMASRTFIQFAKGYGVTVTEMEADQLKSFFFSQFPEIKEYLTQIGTRVNSFGGQGWLERAKRLSGDRRFCQLANFYFQGLAAEGGLTAFTRVSENAYTNPSSPMYGTRPVLFVHDEIIVESPIHKAHDAAMELKRVMETSMAEYTPDIPSLAEPTLATKWWKGAYQKFDSEGRLVPSDLED